MIQDEYLALGMCGELFRLPRLVGDSVEDS
jgi:hypothetical protein